MARINVAIIGCGYVASSHLSAWRRISNAEVVAVCDSNERAVSGFADRYKIQRRFTDVSKLSDSKDVTLWDICTPISTHKELATQGMSDGFDVLIEKPMTITAEEAKEIVDCQRTTGRRAGAIHNWLFEPPVMRARVIVNKGDLGEVYGAQISAIHTKDDQMSSNRNHWSHLLPGGRITEMLIHPIYILRSFLGEVKVESVRAAKVGVYSWMKLDELFATFSAEKKFAGTYVSFNSPRNSIYLDLYGQKGIIRLDIINATLNFFPAVKLSRLGKVIDSNRQAVQIYTSTLKNAFNVLSGRWYDGHEMCIRLFAQSLLENTAPPVTVKEAFEVVTVLESLYNRLGPV